MNIVFMGTPEFAVPSLKAIHRSAHNLISVVTAPDKPKGRGLKTSESPVKQYAKQQGLKVLQPVKLKDPEFVDEIRRLSPDLIIIVAFRILPPEVFTIPKYGSVNLHASLLPKYRGAAPVNWAVIRGEKETGVTTFFLKQKVDTGNIIMQETIAIEDDDNAGTLHDKLMNLGSFVLVKTIELIDLNKGNVAVLSQDDRETTSAPRIFKDDCKIIWDVPSVNVRNLIRGLSPYPAAFTQFKGRNFKLLKASLTDIGSINGPGEIIVIKNDMFVSCQDNLLKIDELQPEAKRRMSAAEFLAGHKFEKGDKFTY